MLDILQDIPTIIWILIGIVMVITEIYVLYGAGFLFLGLGSLSTAILIHVFKPLYQMQITTMGVASLFWFAVLWRPLKKYGRNKADKDHFSDLIGRKVVVFGKPLGFTNIGTVKWSGTVMNARLVDEKKSGDDNKDEYVAAVGAELFIIKVEGNVLFCSRSYKKPRTNSYNEEI